MRRNPKLNLKNGVFYNISCCFPRLGKILIENYKNEVKMSTFLGAVNISKNKKRTLGFIDMVRYGIRFLPLTASKTDATSKTEAL